MRSLKTRSIRKVDKAVNITHKLVDSIPSTLEEAVIYIVDSNFATHNCLCGCMRKIVMPLCNMGWTLMEKNGQISFIPSVLNLQLKCRSHYTISNSVATFI